MKPRRSIVLFVCFAMAALPAAAKLRYDPAFVVYQRDARGIPPEGVKPLFDRLLAGNQPVVLFVHGRGDEPGKSLQGGDLVEGEAVRKLEEYGTKVVLFSWDSKKGGGIFQPFDRDRPLANTPEGARRFAGVIEKLDQSLAQLAASGRRPPPLTLLAQSMGTIVLQKYVDTVGWRPPAGQARFNRVVLSSADADNLGHAAWVDKIASVERVFVTVNPSDSVLKRSKEARAPNAAALGLVPGDVLAQHPMYVHIDLDGHEVFTRGRRHPEIERFFAAVFAGTEIPPGDPLPPPGRRFRLR